VTIKETVRQTELWGQNRLFHGLTLWMNKKMCTCKHTQPMVVLLKSYWTFYINKY